MFSSRINRTHVRRDPIGLLVNFSRTLAFHNRESGDLVRYRLEIYRDNR